MRYQNSGSKSHRAGITAVELVLVLALAAVVAGGAFWAFSTCSKSAKEEASTSSLEAALADSEKLHTLVEGVEKLKAEFAAIKKRREEARKELDSAEAEYDKLRKSIFGGCDCEGECCEECKSST